MAAKLVIIKQVRPNLETPFFVFSDEQKSLLKDAGLGATVGERNYAKGYKKIRTLFFPTLELYQKWADSSTVAAVHAARDAYNTANGIRVKKTEIDFPKYVL